MEVLIKMWNYTTQQKVKKYMLSKYYQYQSFFVCYTYGPIGGYTTGGFGSLRCIYHQRGHYKSRLVSYIIYSNSKKSYHQSTGGVGHFHNLHDLVGNNTYTWRLRFSHCFDLRKPMDTTEYILQGRLNQKRLSTMPYSMHITPHRGFLGWDSSPAILSRICIHHWDAMVILMRHFPWTYNFSRWDNFSL